MTKVFQAKALEPAREGKFEDLKCQCGRREVDDSAKITEQIGRKGRTRTVAWPALVFFTHLHPRLLHWVFLRVVRETLARESRGARTENAGSLKQTPGRCILRDSRTPKFGRLRSHGPNKLCSQVCCRIDWLFKKAHCIMGNVVSGLLSSSRGALRKEPSGPGNSRV